MSKRSEQFAALWDQHGPSGYPLTPEHRFHEPRDGETKRQWRFDFAYLPGKLAIEIEGITHFGNRRSRHQTAKGYQGDCEKYNAATLQGWRVLRYTQRDLDKRPIEVIEEIERALETT